MFQTGRLDVIAGTGNPDFDDDGNVRTSVYTWITQQLWTDLKNGINLSGGNARLVPLLQDKAAINALAAQPRPDRGTVKPLAMIIKGDNSAQFNRTGWNVNPTTYVPFTTPFKTNVPHSPI